MKKVLKILLIPLFIILIRLVLSFMINEIIIHNFNHNKYSSTLIKCLYILNINEPYIAYYNHGNILFMNDDYNGAIEKYEKSLKKHPSKKRVCDIRINLSLAKIKNITTKDPNEIYNLLEEAKKNLYENGCANEFDDSGSSKEAETLENEIKKIQEELENNQEPQNGNSNNNQPDSEIDPKLEEEIRRIQEQASSSRQSDLRDYENMSDYTYYSGRRW